MDFIYSAKTKSVSHCLLSLPDVVPVAHGLDPPLTLPATLVDSTRPSTKASIPAPVPRIRELQATEVPVASTLPPAAPTSAYPDCEGSADFIGDGLCDDSNNNVECDFDGGDCCTCTCTDGEVFVCGDAGYDCQDPAALCGECPNNDSGACGDNKSACGDRKFVPNNKSSGTTVVAAARTIVRVVVAEIYINLVKCACLVPGTIFCFIRFRVLHASP